jgi:hypothetical protein
VEVTSNADTTEPAEIAMHKQFKHSSWSCAIGFSGDLACGAFWWLGSADRLNINTQPGAIAIVQTFIRNGILSTVGNNGVFWVAGKFMVVVH